MSPRLAGIDPDGFRNPPMRKADIVAIGDSHTYGYNVDADTSWPALLGKATGKDVYNLGVGGYGILHYAVLIDMAIAKNPETILLGLYLKNDLATMCDDVARNKLWRAQGAVAGIDHGCHKLSDRGEKFSKMHLVGRWFKENLAMVSILSGYFARRTIAHRLDRGDSGNTIVLDNGHMKTLIQQKHVSLHANSMDLARPEMAQAWRVLQQILRQASGKARAKKILLGVLLIPSKERVLYRTLIAQGRNLPDDYKRLVQNEDQLRKVVADFVVAQGTSVVDVLPEMEKALSRNENLYPPQYDGHTLEAGYVAYARAAQRLLPAQP